MNTHRWPRATTADLRWGPLCDCGNLKTDQALTCSDCAAERRRAPDYWETRTCACGGPKMRRAAMCRPGGHPKRRHDRPLVDASMHQWWKRSIEAAAIPYKNLHVTRHTYATEWRRRGLAMDDVGLLLRHADSRTTERVYVHTKMIDVRKRMEALA